MKKLLTLIILTFLLVSCEHNREPYSDTDYPIGTVVYLLPDSVRAVACGSNSAYNIDEDRFLDVLYTTKLGVTEIRVNKKLIYK